MMKRRTVLAVVIVLLIAVTVGLVAVWPARVEATDDLQPGDTTQVIDGNWELTREWDIVREDSGDELLYVRAADESNAWNTFFRLYEDWTVSAQMQPEMFYSGSSLRLAFGDTNENIGLAVSVNYESLMRVRLSVDGLTNKGWKNYLESDGALDIEDAPVEVKAMRKNGSHKLDITLSQNGQTLFEASTKTLGDEVLRILCKVNAHYNISGADTSCKHTDVVIDEAAEGQRSLCPSSPERGRRNHETTPENTKYRLRLRAAGAAVRACPHRGGRRRGADGGIPLHRRECGTPRLC